MPEENKLVKEQPAFGPVQCVVLTEQPHGPREGEHMLGLERPKAEERADNADQPPPWPVRNAKASGNQEAREDCFRLYSHRFERKAEKSVSLEYRYSCCRFKSLY
eukprot:s8_g1.t1